MAPFHVILDRISDQLQRRIDRYDKPVPPRLTTMMLRPLQILAETVRGYVRNNCVLHASALTFFSLLAVVPVAAMAFGIAKGFGLEDRLERQLYIRFAGQEEVLSKIIDFARTLLNNTQGGLIAGIGVVVLFWSSIKVLSHIESTLNTIWNIGERPFIRKFTNYVTILIISPLLVIVSSSVTVFIKTQVLAATERWAMLHAAGPIIATALKLLPFGLIWLLFIMIYLVMPNTQVRLRSALIAGIIAGSLFQLTQGMYISAQVVVARYNAIYGSFAALPLFLIWLQLSWSVVLLGAQITHAHQFPGNLISDRDVRNSRQADKKRCALLILRWIVQRFGDGASPPTGKQIAQHLTLPYPLVAQLIDHLCQCGLISALAVEGPDGPAYQPAKAIHTIRIVSVLNALDSVGRPGMPPHQHPEFDAVTRAIEAIQTEMDRSPANVLVKDL